MTIDNSHSVETVEWATIMTKFSSSISVIYLAELYFYKFDIHRIRSSLDYHSRSSHTQTLTYAITITDLKPCSAVCGLKFYL